MCCWIHFKARRSKGRLVDESSQKNVSLTIMEAKVANTGFLDLFASQEGEGWKKVSWEERYTRVEALTPKPVAKAVRYRDNA